MIFKLIKDFLIKIAHIKSTFIEINILLIFYFSKFPGIY